ncbi:PHP domain-containing protein [uncultured Methanomethylovorans sp.]|uniref:PHP domain-containing protein n=1 Tax=uncultured Methanomethylovorans sp. TaxID=183759 RepID=UPI002AA64366|nr:PHP domain-containing protein [uncultured Methanomethylovorans sp.]
MKYDLHTHTKYSPRCGYMEPKTIVKLARKRGLDGIAITDHDTIKGSMKTREYADKSLEVIIGSEVMTSRGEVIGLFLSDEILSTDFISVVEEIHDQNGIAIVPHPFDTLRKSALWPTEDDVKYLDGVEGFNARNVYQKSNTDAIEFGKKHKLAITAGSDAHFSNEIGNAGVITDNADLREAILSKEIEIFGKRNGIYNHAFTKGLKLCRKIRRL